MPAKATTDSTTTYNFPPVDSILAEDTIETSRNLANALHEIAPGIRAEKRTKSVSVVAGYAIQTGYVVVTLPLTQRDHITDIAEYADKLGYRVIRAAAYDRPWPSEGGARSRTPEIIFREIALVPSLE